MPRSLFAISAGKGYRLMKVLHAHDLTEDMVDALLVIDEYDDGATSGSSSLARWWVGELKRKLAEQDRMASASFVGGMFTSPSQQLDSLRAWDYFSDHQINAVASALPDFSCEMPLEALTLCWTLNTLPETIAAKLQLATRLYGSEKLHVYTDFRAENLFLPLGAPEFKPNCLWWEVVVLGANRRTRPTDVHPTVAAGTQMFDVLLQHRAYITSQNGKDIPFTYIPGLLMHFPEPSMPGVPFITPSLDGGVHIGVHRSYYVDEKWASPLVRRLS